MIKYLFNLILLNLFFTFFSFAWAQEQNSSGNCSPNMADIKGDVTVNCTKPEKKIKLHRKLELSGGHKIGEVSVSEISRLFDSVFRFEETTENESIKIRLVKDDEEGEEEEKIAVTCRELNYFTNKGFYQKTNWDIKYTSRLLKSCGTLEFLMRAETPDNSFLKPLSNDTATLKLLPVELLELSMLYGSEYKSINSLDKIPGLVLPNYEYSTADICFEIDNFLGMCLSTMAMADINHDGLEDMVVYIAEFAVGGSHSSGTVYALTRFDNNSKYKLLYR